MRKVKLILCLLATVALVYTLNRGWNFGSPIPPLGKFLDPFHGFWQNAEGPGINSGNLKIEGLKDEVTVIYDSLKIPHIFAKNDDDLYFAQGYITATDRLWQMDFQSYAGAGRISEIIGKVALDYDRTQRRLGMTFGAQNALTAIDADTISKSMIDSYGRGVNAFIQTLDYQHLPVEYKLLDYGPEAWSNSKVALLQVIMARTLNSGESDMEMTNALKLFGREALDILYPDNENPGDPVVDKSGGWKFKPVRIDSVPLALPDQLITMRPFDKSSPDTGSNNWAVSGTKTATGSPMLCNDPHLNLNLPSIWYAIHLNAPGVNVMGVSLPGAPAVVIGFNDSIAWGITNAQRDVVDWYGIHFKDSTGNEYLSDGKWKASRKVIEKFILKGGDTFYDTITYTHHGPIVYDNHFHKLDDRSYLAYRWISHDPSVQLPTFYKLNRGKNHADYMKALDLYVAPGQNFAFASVSGDIAIRVQGKYPVRRKGEGKFLLDGTKTSTEWQAFIPNDQNVMDKNPARGFVSSANQYPVDASYPYYVHASSFEAYRNRRINKVLGELSNITPEDLMKLQFDVFNLKASESLPVFLDMLDTTRLSASELSAYRVLKSWDFNNTIDAEGGSYYDAWWSALTGLVWDEMRSSKVSVSFPTSYTTIKLIKEKPDLSFFDITTTPEKETAPDVVRLAFSEGVKKVEDWKTAHHATTARWADYKDTFIGHLLRGLPAFSYHVQHGGAASIVNASTRTHGPSWRMVVSLEKTGVKAWGVYPGGQSGNPGSPYYNNLLDHWSTGKYFTLQFTHAPDPLMQGALATMTLKPLSR